MKRSERPGISHSVRRKKPSNDGRGWPLMHVYQMIAAALALLLMELCVTGILPGGELVSHQINHLIDRTVSWENILTGSWAEQWRITWEEWIHGSEDSR